MVSEFLFTLDPMLPAIFVACRFVNLNASSFRRLIVAEIKQPDGLFSKTNFLLLVRDRSQDIEHQNTHP